VSADVRELLVGFLLWVLLPLWTFAGIADYWLHRQTEIEKTSGAGESRLHVLQALEVGIPLLAGLFLEINRAVLAIMIVGVIAHTLTALWDTSYTHSRRYISPIEQHVHSHLEYIPFVAVAVVIMLHWDATHGSSWALQLKDPPLPGPTVATVLVLVFGVQGLLLGEETVRVMRAAHALLRR
jgi:hypothetical protein